MKKLKKILMLMLCGLLAFLPVLVALPAEAKTATTIKEALPWYNMRIYDPEDEDASITDVTPLEIITSNPDFKLEEMYSFYIPNYFYMILIETTAEPSGFMENDKVTITLPFSTSRINRDKTSIKNNSWDVEYSGNSLCCTCKKSDDIIITFVLNDEIPLENQFWFKPMKTQLAIAADIVATNGGTAVAEASGDFGLSYEIMKYLDDHPGVTLKYTLTYKGEEHLIVIPGGGKCADPEILWYGPEYLIGKFGR